ncbi:MAG: hypothetical protein IPG88_13135 [Gemmatimonadetes bacterium]|nr:hypothetical protein [Gemmatimonadota bacterium]
MENGKVRCWGRGSSGQLGLASTQNIGDNEQPWSVSDVPLGGAAQAIAAGQNHAAPCSRAARSAAGARG